MTLYESDTENEEIWMLPDTAKCNCTGKHPFDMKDCPIKKYDGGSVCYPHECEKFFSGEW